MTTLPEFKKDPDAEHRFWLYNPEGEGMMYFATESDRDTYAKAEICTYLDLNDNGWYEEVEWIMAGVVTHTIKKIVTDTKPEGYDSMDEDTKEDLWPYGDDVDKAVDYVLEPLPVEVQASLAS